MVRGNTSRTASTLCRDRAGRRAAARARGGAHAAIGHVAHASRAAPHERTRRRTRRAGEHRRRSRARAPSRCSTSGRSSCSATARRFAARSSGSTMRRGAVAETRTLPLSELGDHAARCRVRRRSREYARRSPDMALSEIEQHVLYHAKHKTGGFDPLATLRLQHARPANLAAGEITLFDVLEQARGIRRLLRVARGADPEDVNPPERIGSGRHRSRRARRARRQGRERAQCARTRRSQT